MAVDGRSRTGLPAQWNRLLDRLLEEPRLSAALACLGASVSLVLAFGMGTGGAGSRGLQDAAIASAILHGEMAPLVDGGVLQALIVALAFHVLGPGIASLKAAALAAHALALLGLFLLTRDHLRSVASIPSATQRPKGPPAFESDAAPWLVVALFAAHPLMIMGVASGHADTVAILAFAAAVTTAIRSWTATNPGTTAAFAGAFGAIATLARPGLFPAVFLVAFVATALTGRRNGKRTRCGAAHGASLVILLAPWVVWNAARIGVDPITGFLPALLGIATAPVPGFDGRLIPHLLVALGIFAAFALLQPFRVMAGIRRALGTRDRISLLLGFAILAALAAGAVEGALAGVTLLDAAVLALPAAPLILWFILREAYADPAPREMQLRVAEDALDSDALPPWISWPRWRRPPSPEGSGESTR